MKRRKAWQPTTQERIAARVKFGKACDELAAAIERLREEPSVENHREVARARRKQYEAADDQARHRDNPH